MYKIKNKSESGFTLTEVLVTLAIIGIIAALTIPSLVTNIQEQQFKVAWKKIFSDISNATRLIMNDNNGSLAGVFNSADDFPSVYSKYMKAIKIYASTDSSDSYWNDNLVYLNGVSGAWWKNRPRLILANGTIMTFVFYSSSCSFSGGTTGTLSVCGEVLVDINGAKPPNRVGKDVYGFWPTKNGITPYGTQGDFFTPNTDCIPTGTGLGCSMLYITQ